MLREAALDICRSRANVLAGMKARIVIPTASGERLSYDLALHHAAPSERSLRFVFSTAEEPFERWMFYLLRDIGAHVVTDDPQALSSALGVSEKEPGIMREDQIAEVDVTRHTGRSGS